MGDFKTYRDYIRKKHPKISHFSIASFWDSMSDSDKKIMVESIKRINEGVNETNK